MRNIFLVFLGTQKRKGFAPPVFMRTFDIINGSKVSFTMHDRWKQRVNFGLFSLFWHPETDYPEIGLPHLSGACRQSKRYRN